MMRPEFEVLYIGGRTVTADDFGRVDRGVPKKVTRSGVTSLLRKHKDDLRVTRLSDGVVIHEGRNFKPRSAVAVQPADVTAVAAEIPPVAQTYTVDVVVTGSEEAAALLATADVTVTLPALDVVPETASVSSSPPSPELDAEIVPTPVEPVVAMSTLDPVAEPFEFEPTPPTTPAAPVVKLADRIRAAGPKLTDEAVREIVELCGLGEVTMRDLLQVQGVGKVVATAVLKAIEG